MADLGTVSILVDVRGQPIVRELANDLNKVAASETKVSAATQKVMEDFQRAKAVFQLLNRQTAETTSTFERFSVRTLQEASRNVERFNRMAVHTQRSVNGMGVVIQQAGYQAGDFIVQVQSGTNAFVAFGQQATQMVGFLPLLASEVGVTSVAFMGLNVSMATLTLGLSIIVPLITAIGATWSRTSQESDNAAKSVDRQKQAYDALIDRVRTLRLERQMEATGTQSQEEQIVLNDINKLLEDRAAIQEKINQLSGVYIGPLANFRNQQRQDQIELLQIELDKNQAAIDAIKYEEQLATSARRRANEQRNAYREAKEEADRWKRSIEGLKGVLESLNGMSISVSLDLKSTASGWASEFLGKLTAGLENKAAYAKSVGGGRGLGAGGPELDPYGFRRQLNSVPSGTSGSSGGSGGGGGGGGATEDALENLRQQIKLENELLGVSESQERVLKAIGEDRSKYSEQEIAAVTAEIEAYNRKKEALEENQKAFDQVQSSMETAFMDIITGTESAKDAFKKMAYEIIKELYKVLVVQRMVGSFDRSTGTGSGLVGLIGGFFGGAKASGGSVMPGNSYLVGENGPEIVIPRHSGTVVNANQTSGAMGNGGSVVINQSFNFAANGDESVKQIIRQQIPNIAEATKAAVADSKLRGGAYGRAFR